MKCIDGYDGEAQCAGVVREYPSHAGTGMMIPRCVRHQDEADRKAAQIDRDYPDSPIPPPWFDPTYAGERWNEDD